MIFNEMELDRIYSYVIKEDFLTPFISGLCVCTELCLQVILWSIWSRVKEAQYPLHYQEGKLDFEH